MKLYSILGSIVIMLAVSTPCLAKKIFASDPGSSCGKTNYVSDGELPQLVHIQIGKADFCSGFLVRENIVMTSGSCLGGQMAGDLKVTPTNRNPLVAPDEFARKGRRVDKVCSRYNKPGPFAEWDIGFLRLDKPVELEAHRTIEFAKKPFEWTSTLEIAGFGSNEDYARWITAKPFPCPKENFKAGEWCLKPSAGCQSCGGDSGAAILMKENDGRLAVATLYSGSTSKGCSSSTIRGLDLTDRVIKEEIKEQIDDCLGE